MFRKLYSFLVVVMCLFTVVQAEDQLVNSVTKDDFVSAEGQKEMRLFSDKLCFKLKGKVSPDQVKNLKNPVIRQMVTEMMNKTYDVKERARVYVPYYPIDLLSKELKTNRYSQFENPTGIYFDRDEVAVVFVGETKGQQVALKVHCWDQIGYGEEKVYPLEEGVNVFPVDVRGLAYFVYYTADPKAPKIPVNIATGRVNGVFDSATCTNEDWKRLIKNASSDCIDIVGKYVQLIFCAKTMQKYCPDDGLALINTYDEIINLQQRDILGLDMFKRRRSNHMHGRTMWSGFMHADGIGAAFNDNTMEGIATPSKIKQQAWGLSHEFGHVNQTRPNMMWVSTTEVTNNIYSCWANWILNPSNMRLEHERCPDGDGNFIGGRFNSYLNSALVANEQWLCQKGPDKMTGYEDGGDHFVKVAPLWQLQLYSKVAGRADANLYPKLFELARKADVPKKDGKVDNGALQCTFMKNVCDITKQNFMPFFEKVGMLKPIDKELDDYSRAQMTITEADCKALQAYGRKYKMPKSPVIYYISANNVETYKKGLPVQGKMGEGVTLQGDGTRLLVSHDTWKNVVAFETYENKTLTKISMSGLDSKDNASTLVKYPAGSTCVMAVSWDGHRTLVYGNDTLTVAKKTQK